MIRASRHDLIRDIRVITGRVPIDVYCRPAFDYARQEHTIEFLESGVIFRGTGTALNLASVVPLKRARTVALWRDLSWKAGESASFVLQQLDEGEGPREAPNRTECQGCYKVRWTSGGGGSPRAPTVAVGAK